MPYSSTPISNPRRRFLQRFMIFCGLFFFGKAYGAKGQKTLHSSAVDRSQAGMRRSADPFVAEIQLFGFNFAPRGWARCDGGLLVPSQNTALFSLLGTTYGGNGTSNFALPDLQGRTPIQQGQGSGLSLRDLGETGGAATVTLQASEMPAHSHTVSGTYKKVRPRGTTAPVGSGGAVGGDRGTVTTGLTSAGGSQAHNNMPPYLTVNMCIALQGVFPQRP
ncbi:MAG TPA: tail fiber protein [Rhodothermales bacterium]|nr:tail fiber protein [Rhodothermales bacterium]